MHDSTLEKLEIRLKETQAASQAEVALVQGEISRRKDEVRQLLTAEAKTLRQSTPRIERGSADEVLLHHFGARSADEQWVKPVRDLEERLLVAKKSVELSLSAEFKEGLPVLFVSSGRIEYDDADDSFFQHSALVNIDLSQDSRFFSSESSLRNSLVRAFSNEHANIETLTLTVVGECRKAGEMAADNFRIRDTSPLCLHKSVTAEGNAGYGMPSSYSFRNYTEDETLNLGDQRGFKSEYFIGWDEIQGYIGRDRSKLERSVANLFTLASAVGFETFGGSDSTLCKALQKMTALDRTRKELTELTNNIEGDRRHRD